MVDYSTITPALKLWTICILLTLVTQATALDATLQRFKESPGLYYDYTGEGQLWNTEWRIVTCISLQEADQNLETVKKYIIIIIIYLLPAIGWSAGGRSQLHFVHVIQFHGLPTVPLFTVGGLHGKQVEATWK